MIGSAFVENKIQWASKFRSVVALRGDDENLSSPAWLTRPI
jgi:hypothetical protein